MLISSPSKRSAEALDHWLVEQHRRRLASRYHKLAAILKQALHQGGLARLHQVYTEAMPGIQEAQVVLVGDGIRQAVCQAEIAFARELLNQYGAERVRQITAASGLPEWPESIADISLGQGAPEDVISQLEYMRDEFGHTYSSRIWKNDTKSRRDLFQAITEHLRSGNGVLQDAQNLSQFQNHDPTLPAYMRRLEQAGRQALQNVPQAREAFLDALRRAKREAAKLKSGPLGTGGFSRRTIAALEKAIQAGNAAVLDQAIDTYITRRATYRSQVLLRSEGIRAYQLASLKMYQDRWFVLGVQWNLSAAHTHFDQCDVYATTDIGLGPGVYYKNRLPWPDHPNGLCYFTPVLPSPEDLGRARAPVPEDIAAYDDLIDTLRGPIAREANRLGRLKKPAPGAKQDLFKDIPVVRPASPPNDMPTGPHRAPRVQEPTPAVPSSSPWGETAPGESAIHRRAFTDASDETLEIIRHTPPLDDIVLSNDGAMSNYHSSQRRITMSELLDDNPKNFDDVWKHEYGHHIDYTSSKGNIPWAVSMRVESASRILDDANTLRKNADGKAMYTRFQREADKLTIKETEIFDEIVARHGKDYPWTDAGEAAFKQKRMAMLRRQFKRSGIDLDNYLKLSGVTEAEVASTHPKYFLAAWRSNYPQRLVSELGRYPLKKGRQNFDRYDLAQLMDFFGALSHNRLVFPYGHATSYYESGEFLNEYLNTFKDSPLTDRNAKEAFANFFALLDHPNPLVQQILERLAPKTTEVFDYILHMRAEGKWPYDLND